MRAPPERLSLARPPWGGHAPGAVSLPPPPAAPPAVPGTSNHLLWRGGDAGRVAVHSIDRGLPPCCRLLAMLRGRRPLGVALSRYPTRDSWHRRVDIRQARRGWVHG